MIAVAGIVPAVAITAAHLPTVTAAAVACGRNDGSQSCNRARASLITQAVDSSSSSSSFAVSETESPCASGGSKFLPTPPPQRSQIRPTAKKDSEQRQVRNGEEEEEEGRSRSGRTRRRRGRREPGSDEFPTTTAFTRRHLFFGCFLSFSLMDHGRSSMADQITEEEAEDGSNEEEAEEIDTFGFDGLGETEEDYAAGKVVALAQSGDGAVLFVSVDGFDLPLRMMVGAAEAMAILAAAQERRSRRPVTHEAWGSSLSAVGWKVARVTITSMESDVFYSRLVLSLEPSTMPSVQSENVVVPASRGLRSVDMRPSDGIALALRCRAPLFISKKVAEDIVGALKKPADPLNSPGLQAKEDHPLIVNHISNYASSQSKMSSSLIVFSEDEYKRLILRSSEKTQNGSRAL
ncbi:hypothetical protein CY35_16G100300 [Sphagnum magellanicum]|nr:hypothetical protein CY35_16G100300 [Sphagnum magellanicum]